MTTKNILHVDDDPNMHELVNILLGDIANVTSVLTSKEAKELAPKNTYDLFIFDLVLKGGSGSMLTKEFRTKYPNAPIIILSAHDVTDTIDGISAAYVKSHLDKDKFEADIKKLLS